MTDSGKSASDNGREEALRLLGITDEDVLRKIKEVVEDHSVDPRRFIDEVPFPLLLAVRDLLRQETSSKAFSMMKARLDPSLLATLQALVRTEFAELPQHPHFKRALEEGLRKNWKSDGLADADFHSVSVLPLLSGFGPPHFPLLRVQIQDREQRILFSRHCQWADGVFLFHALALGIAENSGDLATQISRGDCAGPPKEVLRDWISRTRQAIDEIESNLLGPEKTSEDS